jgi:hypothetical protein
MFRGCRFLIYWVEYLNVEMKEGLRGQSHLRWDNYEDDILLEMSDYNHNLRISILSSQWELSWWSSLLQTEIDKFIGVTWLLHETYLEEILRSIVCMHIKSSLSWESRVMRLGIDKVPRRNDRSIKWNKFQVLQLLEA